MDFILKMIFYIIEFFVVLTVEFIRCIFSILYSNPITGILTTIFLIWGAIVLIHDFVGDCGSYAGASSSSKKNKPSLNDTVRGEAGIFHDEVYYDKDYNKVGYCDTDIFGDKIIYDNDHNVVLKGRQNVFGDWEYYDNNYNRVFKTEQDLLFSDTINYYDNAHNKVAEAEYDLLSNNKKYRKK